MFKSKASAGGVYTIQCVGADGQVKWEQDTPNLASSNLHHPRRVDLQLVQGWQVNRRS